MEDVIRTKAATALAVMPARGETRLSQALTTEKVSESKASLLRPAAVLEC